MGTEADDILATKAQIEIIAQLAMNISPVDAGAVLREIERTESFMPIFDPTGWIKISKTLPGHHTLVKAFCDFRAALEAIK